VEVCFSGAGAVAVAVVASAIVPFRGEPEKDIDQKKWLEPSTSPHQEREGTDDEPKEIKGDGGEGRFVEKTTSIVGMLVGSGGG
jgi:hypothetical protein